MRKIKIKTWTAQVPEKDENGNVTGQREIKENLLIAINMLLSNQRQEELPKGIEKFRIFGNIAKAFEEAEKTDVLKLKEKEYQFIKDMIEKSVPSTWGMNKNLSKAITDFLEAKEE